MIFGLLFMICVPSFVSAAAPNPSQNITKWQIKWGNEAETTGKNLPFAQTQTGWKDSDSLKNPMQLPTGENSSWTRVSIPAFKYVSPSIYIDTLYALNVKVYVENRLIFEQDRSYIKDHYSLLIPLKAEDNGKTLYIWAETLKDRIGIKDKVVLGENSVLFNDYVKNGLIDVVLGSAFFFVAIVLFVCAFYLNKDYFSLVASLAIVIASTGILSITYSPFIYTFYSYLGPASIVILDVGLLSLLPALTYLFETIFGSGKHALIRRFRKFQITYSLFCLICLGINYFSGNQYVEFYYFVSTTIMGIIMILQFLLLIGYVINFSVRGNKEAIIFAVGFGTAAITGVAELLWYYIHKGNYDLFLWNWGIVIFIVSLIVILGRRLAISHQKVVKYARELELFNNELQRSEKLEIISELAASVAHEVRNPLQVAIFNVNEHFIVFLIHQDLNEPFIHK